MQQAHELLCELMPTALVLAEAPVMSEGTQGRDPEFKFWTAGPDVRVDLLVQDNRGLWLAVEINGPDHRGNAARQRDKKKKDVMHKYNVPVVVLSWHIRKGRRVMRLEQ